MSFGSFAAEVLEVTVMFLFPSCPPSLLRYFTMHVESSLGLHLSRAAEAVRTVLTQSLDPAWPDTVLGSKVMATLAPLQDPCWWRVAVEATVV